MRGEYLSRKRLIETVGLSSAAKLVAAYGGLRYRVPRREEADAFVELARLVGYSAACVMADAFGGERVMLPVRAQPKKVRLQERIAALAAQGKSADEIAATLRMHTRYVYRLLADARKKPQPEQLSFEQEPSPNLFPVRERLRN
jgi:hypothetical protein